MTGSSSSSDQDPCRVIEESDSAGQRQLSKPSSRKKPQGCGCSALLPALPLELKLGDRPVYHVMGGGGGRPVLGERCDARKYEHQGTPVAGCIEGISAKLCMSTK
ncbi:hypothetical protein CIHG_00117 [Coccidioides immitis H538.4]|uniref:Uncharacterized protein n=2 Tax=Coccidioides immitis TaxID=5501 RepID=A0A0J8U5Q1_COCIT|nr:hypothetical protein CIRG_06939 [Coccidioides immitis RMSCC 2394]KMU82333.1 hypothetical protein CIHG_00117 [Coccidioides immitis H538.4]